MMMVKCWSLLWGQMYPGDGSALQHKINPGQLTQFWSSLNFNKGQIEEIISHGLVLQSFHVKQISWQNHEWNRIKFRYTGFREYFKLYSIDGYIYRSIASFHRKKKHQNCFKFASIFKILNQISSIDLLLRIVAIIVHNNSIVSRRKKQRNLKSSLPLQAPWEVARMLDRTRDLWGALNCILIPFQNAFNAPSLPLLTVMC